MNKIVTMEFETQVLKDDKDEDLEEEHGIKPEMVLRKITIPIRAIKMFMETEDDKTIVYMDPINREVLMPYSLFKRLYDEKINELNEITVMGLVGSGR